MLARQRLESVYRAFMDGRWNEFSRSLGISGFGLQHIERHFGLHGLDRAIRSSSHWIRWRASGDDYPSVDGSRRRGVGIRLSVGSGDGEVRLTYYPRVRRRGAGTVQRDEFQVWGGDPGEQRHSGFLAREAHIRRVSVIGKMLKFTGRIVTPDGREHAELWIRPSRGAQGFIFHLGALGGINRRGDGRSRDGSHDAVFFPPYAGDETEADILIDGAVQFPGASRTPLRD